MGDDDEYLSCLSANNDQLEFPPHLTVELAGVAIKYAKVGGNHNKHFRTSNAEVDHTHTQSIMKYPIRYFDWIINIAQSNPLTAASMQKCLLNPDI